MGEGGREDGEGGVDRRRSEVVLCFTLQTGPPPKRTRPVMMTVEEDYGEEDKDDATLFLINNEGGCCQKVSRRG